MNITATILITGAVMSVPASALPDLSIANPIDGVFISAAGIGLEFSGEGVETQPADSADFQIEVRMKSGTPIRVRL